MSFGRLLLAGVLSLPLLWGPTGCAEDLREELRKGWDLTSEQAAALEGQLAANPQDLNLRAQLLGYYFGQPRTDGARHAEHVLWFIRNTPESEILEEPDVQIDPVFNPDAYAEARKLWLGLLEADPGNIAFLRNAATSFVLFDAELSANFFERAESLEPSNPHWAEQLGHLQWLEAHNPLEGPDPAGAARALADFERAHGLSDASSGNFLLTELGMTAFVAGDIEKARTYAESMLEAIPDDWNKGNRIHYGNLVLGRIALAEGDPQEAGARLLAAGQTPGSPQLDSFGPDMTLAKELLERGATQTVVRYLQLCLDFWEMGQDELKKWIVLIEGGRTPDFTNQISF